MPTFDKIKIYTVNDMSTTLFLHIFSCKKSNINNWFFLYNDNEHAYSANHQNNHLIQKAN